MKKQILTFATLLLISFTMFSCKEKVNEKPQNQTITKPELSNQQKAEIILNRAKVLLDSLADVEDPYGLKTIFPETHVTQSRFTDGQWEFFMPEGGFSILFLLSSQEDFDKGCSEPVVMMTTNGSFNGREFPFIIINPQWLTLAKSSADFDYLASTMLHEAVHCWQFFAVQRKLITQPEPIQKEREAYKFQLLFLPSILERNLLKDINVPKGLVIRNQQDMLIAASKIDVANQNRLGMLSNLVLQNAYLETCLPLLVVKKK